MATEMVAFTTVFGPMPVTGVEVQVASAGRPVQANVIAVVKLLEVRMPTLLEAVNPGLVTVTSVGPNTAAKPGWIVKVTELLCGLAEKLGSPS